MLADVIDLEEAAVQTVTVSLIQVEGAVWARTALSVQVVWEGTVAEAPFYTAGAEAVNAAAALHTGGEGAACASANGPHNLPRN